MWLEKELHVQCCVHLYSQKHFGVLCVTHFNQSKEYKFCVYSDSKFEISAITKQHHFVSLCHNY